MKVLITGSSGFVGSSLINRLAAFQEIDILGLDKLPPKRRIRSCRYLEGPIEILTDQIKAFAPQVVIHAAAQVDVRVSMKDPLFDANQNIIQTIHLLNALRDSSCQNFIYLNSGGAIYDKNAQIPYSEDTPTNPESFYGLSKLTAERYVEIFCEQTGIAWHSLALSNVYGDVEINQKGIIFELFRCIRENSKFYVYGSDTTRDYIHVSDVVEAVIGCFHKKLNQRINIGTGIETSLGEIIEIALEETASGLLVEELQSRPGEVTRSKLGIEKAKNLLGWAPKRNIKDDLIEMLRSIS
jgi:UDP-glucose 4-epimerase